MSLEGSKSGFSRITTFVIVLAASTVLAVGGFLYYYLYLRIPTPNVAIEIAKPDRVQAGEPFTVTISYSNNSEHILKDAQFSVILPPELSFLEGAPDQRVREEAIGDVGPGSIGQREIYLIANGGVQTLQKIEAKIRYHVLESSDSKFENSASADVSVGQAALMLSFETPESVFSGEYFDVVINYENNANQEFKNALLKINYPPVFRFLESDTVPSSGENTWDLGTLSPKEKGTVRVRGSVIGEEASFFTLQTEVSSQFFGERYVLNTQSANIGISAAPLSVRVAVNGSGDYVAEAGNVLRYVLTYRNNSDTALQNISLKAVLTGEMYDFFTLKTDGAFNSIANVITWNAANKPEFVLLAPGEERTVGFEIEAKDAFPIRRLSDKNYFLKVQAEIQSLTVPPGITAEKTIGMANLETKVTGRADIRAKAYFYDPDAGIVNDGPYPPRVNQPTEYTVHWAIVNYATDIESVKISSVLQSGSRFTGVVKSTVDTVPTYNAATGEVSWQIAAIPATRGVISLPIEAVFQIELTPAVNQLRNHVAFLSDTVFTARDMFTGLEMLKSASYLTTELPNDMRITIPSNSRGVVE